MREMQKHICYSVLRLFLVLIALIPDQLHAQQPDELRASFSGCSQNAQGQVAQNHAGLVIDFGSGRVLSFCIDLGSDGQMTAEELLLASGLQVVMEYTPGVGGAVCKIDNTGSNFPSEACFAKCTLRPGEPCLYWSFSQLVNNQWVYNSMGASVTIVRSGAINGWAWGEGSPVKGAIPSLVYSLTTICEARQLTSTPTSTATPTNTAIPTNTAMPTSTPMPTATETATETATPTPTLAQQEPAATASATPTNTATAPVTVAPTSTPTLVPSVTAPATLGSASPTPLAAETLSPATAEPLVVVATAVGDVASAPTSLPEPELVVVATAVGDVASAPTSLPEPENVGAVVIPTNEEPRGQLTMPADTGTQIWLPFTQIDAGVQQSVKATLSAEAHSARQQATSEPDSRASSGAQSGSAEPTQQATQAFPADPTRNYPAFGALLLFVLGCWVWARR